MRSIMNGPDTSGIRAESQVGWARIIPESGRITSLDVFNSSTFVLKAVDGRTPGSLDVRTGIFRLSWKSDVDISTYDKAVANLPVGSVAVMEQEDGSWDIAYNIGSRLPGLANSLKTPDSSDPATLELQRNTGNIWQVALTAFCVRFQDESVPNRVSVETRGTEYAYRSRTLTTKTPAPAIGQGQSAIRYDPNGGDGDVFTKVGDSGTTATAAEAGVFLRKGHTFAGWNTKADGTGTAYQAGADVAYPAEGDTLTLYAQWEANTYKTEFRDWRGRTITSGTAKYGTTPTVPALSDTTWLADPDMNFDNVDGWQKSRAWNGSFEFTKDGLISRTRDLYGPIKKPFDGTVHIEFQGDASKAKSAVGAGYNLLYDPSSTNYAEWNVCGKGQASCRYDGYSSNAGMTKYDIQSWLQIDSYDDKGYGELLAKHMQLTQVDPATHNGIARDGIHGIEVRWQLQQLKPDATIPGWLQARHITGNFWLIPPKTRQGIRFIPLDTRTWLRLLELANKHQCAPDDLIFTRHGQPLTGNVERRRWQRALQDAGLPPVTMRAARHFFSTHLAQTGAPEDARKAIMGHAKITTTARYTHWTPETLAALADEAREAIGVGNE